MIEVGNNIIMDDVQDIIIELKKQLELNGIKRFNKIILTKNNIQTNCPFHKDGQERKPSFGISRKNGICHCFGCGWKGTLEEMISNCLGYDDFGLEGSKWLVKNFLTVEVQNRQNLDLDFSRNSSQKNKEIEYISEAELDKYRYYHPYMWKRRLTKDVVNLFDIGYDEKTECLTFPIRDIKGNCLFVARRSVKTKFFHYPEDVEKPVYGLYELNEILTKQGKGDWNNIEIIICESMLDCLTCWVYGKYAVALNGLGNELQFKQLRSLPCRKYILATDMDKAGLKARAKLREQLRNKIVTEYFWDVNKAKDINDMSKKFFYEEIEEVL